MAKTTTNKKAKAPPTKKAPATKAKAAATPTRKPAAKSRTAQAKTAVDTGADLSDEVLKAVESGQRAAIEAVRKFVETVDEALPAIGDRPSRRETVIDGALEMADKLVSTQYDFLRSVVQSADRSLGKPGAAKK
jgi:N-acetylglucosamine kinase-like BadF-type ATPase